MTGDLPAQPTDDAVQPQTAVPTVKKNGIDERSPKHPRAREPAKALAIPGQRRCACSGRGSSQAGGFGTLERPTRDRETGTGWVPVRLLLRTLPLFTSSLYVG